MKSDEIKHEMTLFHTRGSNKMLILDTPSFCDHVWSCIELFSETVYIR